MSAVIVHADEINREHDLARRHARDAVKHAIRCGELLIQKKGELPHGGFTAWIVANCKFKQATANNYMKAAQNPNALGNSIRHLFPSGRPAAKVAQQITSKSSIKSRPATLAPVSVQASSTAADTRSIAQTIVEVTTAKEPDSPLPKVATPLPIASPEASQEVVSDPRPADMPPSDRAAYFKEWQARKQAALSGDDRDLDLDHVKSIIAEYAELYGWGAAAMDLVTWIEEQHEAAA